MLLVSKELLELFKMVCCSGFKDISINLEKKRKKEKLHFFSFQVQNDVMTIALAVN